SSTNFINGLESLQKRYLINKIVEDNILFDLSPILKEYVRNFCQNYSKLIYSSSSLGNVWGINLQIY
ncbi:MAG: hypothetical protein ACKPB9_21310, partial [Dolichospermum sp.]